MAEFVSKMDILAPRDYAFRWHESPHAFERLAPPWESIRVAEKQGSIDTGHVVLQNKVGPVWISMKAQHSQFVQDQQFYDEMSGGPFKKWQHWHRFESSNDQTILIDEIKYRLRGGWLGNTLAKGMVQNKLDQMFAYRRQVTTQDIEDHFSYSDQPVKTIAMTGASGLVGKALCEYLAGGGHRVIRLGRTDSDPNSSSEPAWNPKTGQINFGDEIGQVDSFIHLAGYGIAEKRWSDKVKNLIRDSRVEPTENLAKFIAENGLVRESFLCASAIGFYGDRGQQELDESSERGRGFLADVCEPWENACQPLENAGVRTVNMRFGIILSVKGGALKEMIFPFSIGAGGRVGDGLQYWSWISLYDTLRAVLFSLMNQKIRGPVNFTAPKPVNCRTFTKVLGKVLFRPSLIPLPAFAARLAIGEMADYLLLTSSKVMPKKLVENGFHFVHEELESALRFELGRNKLDSSKLNVN